MKSGSIECAPAGGQRQPNRQLSASPSGADPSRVVLVGNGASLLGSGLGELINAHEVVVRFNHFVIGRYARDAGRRATVWFTGRNAGESKVKEILSDYRFEEIHVHAWRKRDQLAESYRAAVQATGFPIPVHTVGDSVLESMRNYLDAGYSMFSTGAIGVWTRLERFREVALVGFDWWERPAKYHYADNQLFPYPSDRGHQPELEK